MCDFISWIAKPQEGADDLIFFLTDAQVYSERGQKLFANAGSDPIGHSAILAYYGQMAEGGQQYENQNFWDKNSHPKIPEQIASLVATPETLLKNWGRMLRHGVFQNNDLTYIMENAPARWIKPFRDQFFKQADDRDNDDIFELIEELTDNPALRKMIPWSWLEKRLDHALLLRIITDSGEPYCNYAWNKARRKLTPSQLSDIIESDDTDSGIKEKVLAELAARSKITLDVLYNCSNDNIPISRKAVDSYFSGKITKSDLLEIVIDSCFDSHDYLYCKAVSKIREIIKSFPLRDLCYILCAGSDSLKKAAWSRLRKLPKGKVKENFEYRGYGGLSLKWQDKILNHLKSV